MSTKAELQALLERVTRATGPDREIDRELAGYPVGSSLWCSRYTASLDAITALIERELPGNPIGIAFSPMVYGDCGMLWYCRLISRPLYFGEITAISITRPLALTAAFLSAMIVQMGVEHAE